MAAAALMIVVSAKAQNGEQPARVWEAPLVIPTYDLGPPDPYPPFPDGHRRRRRPFYPYPALDDLTGRRVDKSYKAVFLENEYLRVTVLPELGAFQRALDIDPANERAKAELEPVDRSRNRR